MGWFGKKKIEAAPLPKDAIANLRDMLVTLEKKEKHLQVKIDQELTAARENSTKNKRMAMMALKRKKQYEADMEKLHGTITTLETQMMTIENANLNIEALSAMKVGSSAMKTLQTNFDLDKVDETMDEIRNQMDIANELSNAIAQPVGINMIDEDELAQELLQFEHEALDDTLLKTTLPTASVPTKEPTIPVSPLSNEAELEAELEELKASMAL